MGYGQTLTRGDVVGTGVQSLVVEECGVCAVLFAMPEVLRDKALADHSKGFWCVNGHKLFFQGKTEAQKLQERLDDERRRSARIAADRDQIQASLSATKGQVTKLRKRVAAGVCPCCGRTFQQLARHMENKHPDYATPERLAEEAAVSR